MKKNTFISIALIGGLVLLSSACVKEITSNEDQFRPAGTQIPISAATGYDNGIETRAEYSGELFGSSPTYERIDWVEDDPICVVYNGTAKYYTVGSTVTAQNEISKTDLDGDLSWDGSGNHTFFALYPAASTGTNGSLTTDGVVTGSIPATQDVTSKMLLNITDPVSLLTYDKYQPDTENYGYLVAHETITGSNSDPSVVLHFKPAVTTFEFKFKRNTGDPDPKILSAELETETIEVGGSPVHTPLTGGFSFKILGHDGRGATWNKALTGQDPTTLDNLGYKITVGFGANGVNIPDNSYLDFSFLALPIDLTGVKITLNYEGGTKKVLRLKDTASDWHTFTGAKKYIITNDAPSGAWKYVIEEIDDIITYGHSPVGNLGYNVKSYRYNEFTGDSEKEAVRWKTQYTFAAPDDPNPTWTDLPAGGIASPTMSGTTFAVNTLTGTGVNTGTYSAGEDRSASIGGTSPSHTYSGGADDAAKAILHDAPQRGTSSNPFDLSRHPSYNIDRVVSQTTANCYVVSAPGYYMFPCVYGNAITNGQDNKSAYWPGASNAPVTGESFSTLAGVQTNKNVDKNYWVYYTPRFYNALNNKIQNPYILTDVGRTVSQSDACVVWQDTNAGEEIIPYPASGTTPTNIGLTEVDGVAYIWFYIDKDNIQPGNIVIALRSPAIIWSWHIWVTEKDLTPSSSDVVSNAAGDFTLMPYNLGWVDTATGQVTVYDNRTIRYRLIQVDSNNNPITGGDNEEFSVTQIGDSSADGNSIGNNPYYQWGRKDPLIPAISATNSKIASPNPEYSAYIVPGQNAVAELIGGSPSPNYAPGIQNPYSPYLNYRFDGTHAITSWIGGMCYPFCSTAGNGWYPNRIFTQALTFDEAMVCNNNNLTDGSCWIPVLHPGVTSTPTYWDYDYYFDHYTGHVLTNDEYYAIWNSIPSILPTDFDSVGAIYPPASDRTNSAAVMNLWNSYAYQEDIPNCADNKFKTVYDPCPPGFTVPTKKVFLANKMPGELIRHSTSAKNTVSTLPAPSLVSQVIPAGLKFGSIFFPFTGDRVYDGAVLKPQGFGEMGLYWTDSPFQIDWANYGGAFGTENRNAAQVDAFSFYHSAYMFVFNDGLAHAVQAFTRGSACSIRPMVDPKYNNN